MRLIVILAAALLSVSSVGAASSPDAGRKAVRAVHVTAWTAGSTRARRRLLEKMEGTSINAVVIDIKETDGNVYVPGFKPAALYGTSRIAIPKPREMLAELKERGLRVIARIVVFKDNDLARKKPEWAVLDTDGGLWTNELGITWLDPYRREAWDYNIGLAAYAAELGFDEVQFDYVRFPSDGDIEHCRYSRKGRSGEAAVELLGDFLRAASERLRAEGAETSVAVFGLATSAKGDLGIGQDLPSMARFVDHLSPMIYPSHYAPGAYGIEDPNREPYRIARHAVRDAVRRLGDSSYKLRPYFQDFSLGYRYGSEQVRAQLRAAAEQGVRSWILWNPGNRYTWEALRPDPPKPDVTAPSRSPGTRPSGAL